VKQKRQNTAVEKQPKMKSKPQIGIYSKQPLKEDINQVNKTKKINELKTYIQLKIK
jgi:hypothetical protein